MMDLGEGTGNRFGRKGKKRDEGLELGH